VGDVDQGAGSVKMNKGLRMRKRKNLFRSSWLPLVACAAVAAVLLAAATGCSKRPPPPPPQADTSDKAASSQDKPDTGEKPDQTPPASQPAASAPASAPASQPAASQPAPSDEEKEPDDGKVMLQFKNTPVEGVMQLIFKKTGKPIIPRPEVVKKKITIFCPEKVDPDDVLPLIYAALLDQGIAVVENERLIKLIPVEHAIKEGLLSPQEKPHGGLIDRTFHLKHATPSAVKAVLDPLKSSYANIAADDTARRIILTDNAESVERLGGLIKELDVPGADQAVTQIFRLKNARAEAVVQALRGIVEAASRGPGGAPGQPSGAQEVPVVLTADAKENWIVASAGPERMEMIASLVAEFDEARAPDVRPEMIDIKHADPDELVGKVTELLDGGRRGRRSETLRLVAYAAADKVLVFGSSVEREMIREMIEALDTESAEKRIQKTFKLTYADATETAEAIEELYQKPQPRGFRGYFRRAPEAEREARAIPIVRTNSILVLASPDTMKDIDEQIKTVWDIEVDTEELAPRVYHLKNSNAEDVADLLTQLFTEFEEQGGSIYDYFFGGRSRSTEKRDIGRLYGTARFEPYPRSNSIVVVATSVEAFDVVAEILEELDAEIPGIGNTQVIELLYADAEDICERLNALFSQSGTMAEILRGSTRLTPGYTEVSQNQEAGATRPQQQQESPGKMSFWWQRARQTPSEQEITQLIGQIRIVPYQRSRSLLVTAPPEYMVTVEELIRKLDQPARQVLVQVVIAEVALEDLLNLGMRFSSDTSLFGVGESREVTDYASRAIAQFTFTDRIGTGTLQIGTDVNVLLQFLERDTNLRIRSSPSIFTSDNEQAEFFDGADVPFIKESQTTPQGGLNQSFEYKPVGITLQVLPHITQNREVDMNINVELSRLRPGETLFGGFVIDRRQTKSHLVVKDGQTIVISGILRQEDRHIIRRVPILGYIPILDLIFSHKDKVKANTELLIFLTPRIALTADEAATMGEDVRENIDLLVPPRGIEPDPKRDKEAK